MLIAARQARTANTHAPLQERAATATGRIRDLFRPSMRYWAHARSTQQMSGAVAAVLDASGRGVTIDQATASKQPLAGSIQNVKTWVFDGVNDCLRTASVDLTNTAEITMALVQHTNAIDGGVYYEASDNYNNFTNAWRYFQNSGGQNLNYYTNGGGIFNARAWAQTLQAWTSYCVTHDRAAAGVDETKVYRDGAQITSFITSVNSNLTGNWGNHVHNIGSLANGTLYAANCAIASICLLQVKLSAADSITLSTLLRQASGVV